MPWGNMGVWGAGDRFGCPGRGPEAAGGVAAVPTLPLGDLALAMRGERRAPLPRGVPLGVLFRPAARRRRLFLSFLGVLRMLNASDWRLSACGDGGSVSWGQDGGS